MNKVILKNGLNHVIDFDKLSKDSIMIDAGAAIGGFVDEIRKHDKTKNSKIYCFECSKSNIEKFKKRNFDENVFLIEKALSNIDGDTIEFSEFIGELKSDGNHRYYQWGNIMNMYSNKLSNDNSVEIIKYKIETQTLDSFITENNIEKIDYLKMDIEGSEYDVLFNMSNETADKINQISLETHNHKLNNKLIKTLEKFGFKVEKFDNDEYYGYK